MTEREYKKLLVTFASGDMRAKYNTLKAIITLRKQHAAVEETTFSEGLQQILTFSKDSGSADLDKLLAITILSRIKSTVKRLSTMIDDHFSAILCTALPSPELLPEADDRAYIGRACVLADPSWAINYCAKAVVLEKSGEQARDAFLASLFHHTKDLSTAIAALRPALVLFVPETEDPGNSMALRVKRILASLQNGITASDLEPGESPGTSLAGFVRQAFEQVPKSKNLESLLECGDGVAGVINALIQLRFSLATEADTYRTLKMVKAQMLSHEWEKHATQSVAIGRVVRDITEAILILARQGITDAALGDALVVATGSPKQSKLLMKKLANSAGLTHQVREYLATGMVVQKVIVKEKIGETRQIDEDTLFSDIFVSASRFKTMESVQRNVLLPEIEMFDPRSAEEIGKLLNIGSNIADAIGALARRKGLSLRGEPGDVVDYQPQEHEVVGATAGMRKVKIIRPAVAQSRNDGVEFIIRKGFVEPA